jgi:hypothetical protein
MQIGICPFVDFGLQIIPSSCHGLRVLPAIAAAPGKLHNGKASRRCVGQNVCIIYCGNVRISCLRWFWGRGFPCTVLWFCFYGAVFLCPKHDY